MRPKKVQVTERALVQRINRALTKRGRKLIKVRSLGVFAVVYNGHVSGNLVCLESLAKAEGAMKEWEALER